MKTILLLLSLLILISGSAPAQITQRTMFVEVPASGLTNKVGLLRFAGGATGTWDAGSGILTIYTAAGDGPGGSGGITNMWLLNGSAALTNDTLEVITGGVLSGVISNFGSRVRLHLSAPAGATVVTNELDPTFTAWLTGPVYLTGGPVVISNALTVTGTLSANSFIGDGAGLTGISAGQVAGVITNVPLRRSLLPGAALSFGSISNAPIVPAPATGYDIQSDTLQFDPVLPQIAVWQFDARDYTGGTINVEFTWSEPGGGAKTNVWAIFTAQATSNSAPPLAWTPQVVLTQAVATTTTGVVLSVTQFEPQWTARSKMPAWLGLQRLATNAFNTAASTSSVYAAGVTQ